MCFQSSFMLITILPELALSASCNPFIFSSRNTDSSKKFLS